MSSSRLVPLRLAVDEMSVLPRVGSVADLKASVSSCYCELLAADPSPAPTVGYVTDYAGEVETPPFYHAPVMFPPVHLFKVVDAFVVPDFGLVISSTGDVMKIPMAEASYASPDLLAVPGVVATADGVALEISEELDTWGPCAVTMPFGAIHNYGHFVMDCLTSASLMLDARLGERYTFVNPTLNRWQKSYFDLIGLDNIQIGHGMYKSTDVVYTSAADHFLQYSHRGAFQSVQKRLGLSDAPAAAVHSENYFYLSRHRSVKRVFQTNDELLGKLKLAGFDSIEGDLLSVHDQMRIFESADVIIGDSGAAFCNIMYCKPGTKIIEIVPMGMQALWVAKLAFSLGLEYYCYFCASHATDPARPEQGLTYAIDLDAFIDYVKKVMPSFHIHAAPPPPSSARKSSWGRDLFRR